MMKNNTDLKVWIDDYIAQMEFEKADEESEVYLEYFYNHYECYELGVGHGMAEGVLETLKLIRSRL